MDTVSELGLPADGGKKKNQRQLNWISCSHFSKKKKRINGLCGLFVFTNELAQQLKCPSFLEFFFFLNDEDVLHCCTVNI